MLRRPVLFVGVLLLANACVTGGGGGGGNAGPPVITTDEIPHAFVGRGFVTSLTATGGRAPLQWVVTEGALPPGLDLETGGAITGTPTADAPFSVVTIRVTDAASNTASRRFAVDASTPTSPLEAPQSTGPLPEPGALLLAHRSAPEANLDPFPGEQPPAFQIAADGTVSPLARSGTGPAIAFAHLPPLIGAPPDPDGQITIRNGTTGAIVHTIPGPGSSAIAAIPSPDGAYVAAEVDGAGRIYETTTWSVVRAMPSLAADGGYQWLGDSTGLVSTASGVSAHYVDALTSTADRTTVLTTMGECLTSFTVSRQGRMAQTCPSTPSPGIEETTLRTISLKGGPTRAVLVGRRCDLGASSSCVPSPVPSMPTFSPSGTRLVFSAPVPPRVNAFGGVQLAWVDDAVAAVSHPVTTPVWWGDELRIGSSEFAFYWSSELEGVVSPPPLSDPPVITTGELPDGVYGTPYSAQIDVTGDGPFTFRTGPFSPLDTNGLSLSATGLVSGVPTAGGSPLGLSGGFVVVTDADGQRAARLYVRQTLTEASAGETPDPSGIGIPEAGSLVFAHAPSSSGGATSGLWQLGGGGLRRVLSASGSVLPPVRGLGISPDLTSWGGGPLCYDARTFYPGGFFGSQIPGCAAYQFSPDGSLLATVGNTDAPGATGVVEIWDASDLSLVRRVEVETTVVASTAVFPAGAIWPISWSPDSDELAFMTGPPSCGPSCVPTPTSIRVVGVSGPAGDRTLATPSACLLADWAPTGRISASCATGSGSTHNVLTASAVDGSDQRIVVTVNDATVFPIFSPTGLHLALRHEGALATVPDQAAATVTHLTDVVPGSPSSSDVPYAWLPTPLPGDPVS